MKNIFIKTLGIIFCVCTTTSAFSQYEPGDLPFGDQVEDSRNGDECRLYGTSSNYFEYNIFTFRDVTAVIKDSTGTVISEKVIYTAPKGVDIIACRDKYDTFQCFTDIRVLIVLSNGQVISYKDNFLVSPTIQVVGDLALTSYETIRHSEGDRFYVLTSSRFLSTIDTGVTWINDTTGIGGYTLNDFAVDSFNNVWMATNNGLWFQPDGGPWSKIVSCPLSTANKVIVTNGQRIVAASSNYIYVSNDAGVTWNIDTAGLGGRRIINLSGDHHGNLYAIVTDQYSSSLGNYVLKSIGGTGAWTSIASTISSQTLPVNKEIFSGIAGQYNLYLSTVYGTFYSNDLGVTWTPDNNVASYSDYSFTETSTGRRFLTTNLGAFYRDPSDVSWTHCFPPYGYIKGGAIGKDNASNLYTIGENASSSPLGYQYVNYKSTDNGVTWAPDSAGLSTISGTIFYADETGVQHWGDISGGTLLLNIYVKPAGSPWTKDTVGLSIPSFSSVTAFYSDHAGNLYVSFDNGSIWKRPIAGGTWTIDSAGLNSFAAYAFAQTNSGTLLAGTYNGGIQQQVSGIWQNFPSPSGVGGSCFALTVDTANDVIANYSYFDAFFNAWGYGVYWTNDNGTTWHSFGLDTITFRQLVAVNDTTFGVSYGQGVFKFYKANNNYVYELSKDARQLQVYPNPTNDFLTIRCDKCNDANAVLSVIDISGKIVEKQNVSFVSNHTVQINTAHYAKGNYIAQVISNGELRNAKFVVR